MPGKDQTKQESASPVKSATIMITAILLGIVAVIGSVIYGDLKSGQNAPAVSDNPKKADNSDNQMAISTDPGVVISTDKDEYNKGETIKISVENKRDKPLLYFPGGNGFWSIEYSKDGKWINGVDERNGYFQLAQESVGEACYVILYERPEPVELKPGAGLSGEWNQKICYFGTVRSADDQGSIEYIKNGRYRFAFFYGFEIDANDPFALSDYHYAAYSDTFTVK